MSFDHQINQTQMLKPYCDIAASIDPLGIGTRNGQNLPNIGDAFRRTGTVCVERTLRILNKTDRNNLMASTLEDPHAIPNRIKASFGGGQSYALRASKSCAPGGQDDYVGGYANDRQSAACIKSNHSIVGTTGVMQQKRQEDLNMLKEIQNQNASLLLNGRFKVLKTVMAKNKQLVDSVPKTIAKEDVK